MKHLFNGIKLYFTDRKYYEQWKRYTKLQKTFRKKLMKQAKEFCPWSGWYMNEMIKTMLNFYHETYLAGDCCWSEESRVAEIAVSLGVALEYAKELENLDDLGDEELIGIAQENDDFDEYVTAWEQKVGAKISESNQPDSLLSALAYEYLEEKYTTALYNNIGEHIWEWRD